MLIVLLVIFTIICLIGPVRIVNYVLYGFEQPKELDYDNRWNDKNYIKLIHKTRQSEAAVGFELTECLCEQHKPKPSPKPRDCVNCGMPIVITATGECFSCRKNFYKVENKHHAKATGPDGKTTYGMVKASVEMFKDLGKTYNGYKIVRVLYVPQDDLYHIMYEIPIKPVRKSNSQYMVKDKNTDKWIDSKILEYKGYSESINHDDIGYDVGYK